MTYPTPAVVEALNREFVCYSVNTDEPGVEGRELLRTYRLLWEPAFVFLEPRGAELRRFVGYRPPHELLAELHFVLGLLHSLYQEPGTAAQWFRRAAAVAPEAATAPEGLYWAAIAEYRRDGRSRQTLFAVWDELRERYPESTWWQRADVLAFPPTGIREPVPGGGSG